MLSATLTDSATTTGLALLSVSLWTGRVALTAQGRKAASALMAAVEATVFVVAFSRLLSGLDSPTRIVAYATGVAGGTLLALVIDGAVNPQIVKVDIVDGNGPDRVLAALHRQGWPTTLLRGESLAASVDVVSVTATEGHLPALLRTVDQAAPDAFWTVMSVRQVGASPVPHGFTQVARGARRWPPRDRSSRSPSTRLDSPVVGSLGDSPFRQDCVV